MRTTFRAILVCVLLLGFFTTGVEAQVTLTSPSNGANLSSEPTFSWSGGSYDVYLLISVFYYDLGYWSDYYAVKFWLANTGFAMPSAWWDKVGEDTPCYWAVLGYNTATHQWAVSSVFYFTKGDDCTDNDGDGYGSPGSPSCPHSELDCDDNNLNINPGATEGRFGDPTCSDGLDNNCDGLTDIEDSGCVFARPNPDPCGQLPDTTCYAAVIDFITFCSTQTADGVLTVASDSGGDLFSLYWVHQDNTASVSVAFPDFSPELPPLHITDFDSAPPNLREANELAAAMYLLNNPLLRHQTGISIRESESCDRNKAGCDVINSIPFLGSCSKKGACCDEHDRCIHDNCAGPSDHGFLFGCSFTELGFLDCLSKGIDVDPCRSMWPQCSSECVQCQEDVFKCYKQTDPGLSNCCSLMINNCGECEECISGNLVITDSCECKENGLDPVNPCLCRNNQECGGTEADDADADCMRGHCTPNDPNADENGCIQTQEPPGSRCNDEISCTTNDTCSSDGWCMGSADSTLCTGYSDNIDDDCLAVMCYPSLAPGPEGCIQTQEPRGSRCDDGVPDGLDSCTPDGQCM